MFQDPDDGEFDVDTNYHKEERKPRRKLDMTDRQKILEELRKYPNPLQLGDNVALFNIVNGRVADEKVNVHNALAIGECMVAEFKGKLPAGFYKPIQSKVTTMESMKKGIKLGDKTIYDMEKLYGRLLVLSQKRDITLENLLSFELSPVPPSLFDEYGSLRKGTKSIMLHKLAVWCENRHVPEVDIIDGNEMLYHITWPKVGKVKNLLQNFTRAAEKQYSVIVVFDRYMEQSIKTHERTRRTGGTVYPKLNLSLETSLPARDLIMKCESNKKELINVFCSTNDSPQIQMIGETNSEFKHEEADCNIISHVQELILQGYKHINVVADDTDIFVLLIFFCWKWQCSAQITMRKFDGRVIDINATAHKLGNKSLQLLAVHAISGCDTVSYMFGKGKASAVSTMLKHDVHLEVLGEEDANLHDVLRAGHKFVSLLYKDKQVNSSMNQLRHTIFTTKKDTPKIKSLPPTDLALNEHIKRAHLQTMLWKAADQKNPPEVDISDFGWNITAGVPIPHTGVSVVAPVELMKVVACGCTALNTCSRNNCSCKTAGVSCTAFCKCTAQDCNNPHTKQDEDIEDETEEYDQ